MFSWLKRNKNSNANHWIFGTMLVTGILGLVASFILSVERVEQLANPGAVLICDVNTIFNCGTVMQTWQAKLFGFPNSFLGLMGFSVVITLAVAALAGVKFPKKFMQAAQIGYGLGLIFAYWLFFQSVFVIEVLCPFCLVVTVVTTVAFETLLHYNLRENNLNLPKNLHKKAFDWLQKDYDKLFVAGWLALMVAIVLVKFPGIF